MGGVKRERDEDKVQLPYLIAVSPILMLGPVRGVAECLGAAGELAHVGLLPGVGPEVGLQVLQPAVRLPAALKLYTKPNIKIQQFFLTIKIQCHIGPNFYICFYIFIIKIEQMLSYSIINYRIYLQ